jgi:hypothetical protein
VLGAQQALLLGAPEREAQRAPLEAELGHLDGQLEVGCRARAVVVDARAGRHGIEVRAEDDRLRRVAAALVVAVETWTVTAPARAWLVSSSPIA